MPCLPLICPPHPDSHHDLLYGVYRAQLAKHYRLVCCFCCRLFCFFNLFFALSRGTKTDVSCMGEGTDNKPTKDVTVKKPGPLVPPPFWYPLVFHHHRRQGSGTIDNVGFVPIVQISEEPGKLQRFTSAWKGKVVSRTMRSRSRIVFAHNHMHDRGN